MNYRNTFAEVNLGNITHNVEKIISTYPSYKYYIGVVKADSYGHDDLSTVKAIIAGGCNYLAVATLDEALIIRNEIKDIPILCLGVINHKYLNICLENNIDITVNSLDYLKDIDISNLNIHIKLNTGMNRLGIKDKDTLITVYNLVKSKELNIVGIYSHLYNATNNDINNKQLNIFKELIESIDYRTIPIIHLQSSEGIINLEKYDFINGCRLGIIMYGFSSNDKLKLKSTFSLFSEVIQINKLEKGESLGYSGKYIAENPTKIAVVSIGYADGIIRQNTGRYVYINNKRYPIVGNICMDMLFVEIDDSVKVGDKVEILKDKEHILEVANYLNTIPYEMLCTISKRVPRVYIK